MNQNLEEHRYSPYALDRYWVEGPGSDGEMERHLASCERCRAYLAHLAALGEESSVVQWPARRAPSAAFGVTRRRAFSVFAGTVAVAAAAVFAWVRPSVGPDGYVGEKGGASVQVLIKGPSATRIWDGRAAIHPGDAIALRVACAGFYRVAVLTRSSSEEAWGAPVEVACPATQSVLPFTLIADQQGHEEQVGVVFSRTSVDAGDLSRSLQQGTRTDSVWVFHLHLPK